MLTVVSSASIVASAWACGAAVVMAVLFAVAGGALIDVLTTAPEVREVARRYLPWLVLMPVVGVASWMLDGIFIGATLTREMRNAMLPAVAIFGVAALTLPPLWVA